MRRKSAFIKVQSLTNHALIADKCFVAVRFFDRLRGLIGRKNFSPGEAMLFPACNDIHMWFMSIPIDVVFLRRESSSGQWRVTSAHAGVRPWKLLPLRDGKGEQTLELPVGTIEKAGIQAGDELCID
jgi:hypothetical protein